LYLQNGSLDKAESDWRAAAKLSPGGWVDLFEAAIALQRGRFSDVPGALHRMRSGGSRDLQSRAYALLACFYVEQGAGDVAVRWLNDGMVFDRSNGQPRAGVEQKQRLLAEFYLQQGEKGETLKICRTALENISGLQMRMRFGSLLARAGDLQGAMRLAAVKGPAWPMYAVWPKALAGEIALAKGQPRQAVSIMQQAVSPAALRHWPDYLGRAAVAAEDYAVAGACFSNLLTRPGLYWLAADQNLPGMLRFAASAVKGLHQWPALRERVDFLQPLLQNR
jgi:tetratricopeptide (TPR) repeat protein